jgi:hypothetical protein
MERGMRTMNWVQFFVHHFSSYGDKFFSDRMSNIILRGRWFHIVLLKIHASTEDKIDDVKDSFCEDFERAFEKFHK